MKAAACAAAKPPPPATTPRKPFTVRPIPFLFPRYPFPVLAQILAATLFLFVTATAACATDSIETAGDILQLVLPATAGGLTLAYRDWTGTLQFGESAGLTLGTTYLLKYTTGERRPTGSGHDSFPSAHTSISFCAAEFMRKRYGLEYGIPAYAAAAFVGYSRVEAREHYPHDVVAGAAIGIVSSYIFTRPYKGWHVQLEGDSKYIGFRLTRPW